MTAAARPARWRHPAGWTLRTRLVAAMIVLIALACLLAGTVTELALRHVLYGQLDARLAGAAHTPPPDERGDGDGPAGRIGTLNVTLSGGQVTDARWVDDSGVQRAVPGSAYATLRAIPVDGRPHTYTLPGLGAYRVVAQPDRGAVQITGLPMSDTYAVLYGVAAVAGGITLVVLIGAGVAGVLIVRRTLRPLNRVAATAGRVAELRLDRGEVALAERVAPADTDPRTEVGQVGAALNRMLEHVGAALEARHASETQVRHFLADASHELRTPLAAIRGYAELPRRSRQRVPPELAHALSRVESEADRMTTLVEDMLLLARLDAGRPLERVPVDLTALAVNAVSDAHAAGPDHRWRVDLPDEPVVVTGDPARLHQVLANLLANARTHTPARTTVTVGVATEGRYAVLRVADTGPGIPDDLVPHLFERFARGDTSRSRTAGSTGLGLAIVQAVMTAHGGSVEVDSEPGRTVFTVRLARPPGATAVAREAAGEAAPAR